VRNALTPSGSDLRLSTIDDLMALDAHTWGLTSVQQLPTSDRVLGELRRGIVSGRIGPGAQLRETALAQTLGTGRSAVREAVRQLVGEGLVEYRPNRGVYVRTITAQDSHDLYRAREAIEVNAVHWALIHHETLDLTALQRAFDRIIAAAAWSPANRAASLELIAADLDFHRELVRLARSPRLTRAHETLAAEAQMLMHHQPVYPLSDYAADHTVLLEAIAGRDPAAPERVREHLRLSNELIVAEITRLRMAEKGTQSTGGELP